MLDELWGVVMALMVIFAVLFVVVGISRALLGNIGTALLILAIALASAWAGWQWLIHSDHLALQMLGWSIAGATVLGTLKVAQIGVRTVREARMTEEYKAQDDEYKARVAERQAAQHAIRVEHRQTHTVRDDLVFALKRILLISVAATAVLVGGGALFGVLTISIWVSGGFTVLLLVFGLHIIYTNERDYVRTVRKERA